MAATRVSTKGKKLSDFPLIAAELAPGQEEALGRGAGSEHAPLWRCAQGHEWRALIGNRIALGNGCPYCSGRKVVPERSLAVLYPEVAAELVGHDPKTIAPRTSAKHQWQCRTDPTHCWPASVLNRTRQGSGCPYCAGKLPTPTNNLLVHHPEIAAQLVDRDPTTLLPGSSKKVFWQCSAKEYHVWDMRVVERTAGKNGCPYCAGYRFHRQDSLGAQHPELAAELLDVDPMSVQIGIEKLRWQCSADARHIWEAQSAARVRLGSGCPYCCKRQVLREESFAARHPTVLAEWDWDANEGIDPWALGEGSAQPAAWICGVNAAHKWTTTVRSRAQLMTRCAKCRSHRSLPELILAYELATITTLDLEFREIPTDGRAIELDLAWPEQKVALEYDGGFWHRDKEEQDRLKGDRLAERGWALIRIRELPLSKITETDLLVDSSGEPLRLVKEVARHLHAVLGEQIVSAAALAEVETRTELAAAEAARVEWERLRFARPLIPQPKTAGRADPVRQAAVLAMGGVKTATGVTAQEVVAAQGWPLGCVYMLLKQMIEGKVLVPTGTYPQRWRTPRPGDKTAP